MALIALIKQYALQLAEAGNWQGVADALNQQTVTARDSQAWTYSKIGQKLGAEIQFASAIFMATAADSSKEMEMSHQLLLLGDGEKTGLRLDDDFRQSRLQSIIDSQQDQEVKAVLTAIRSLGVYQSPVLPVPTNAIACEAAWRTEQVRLLTEKWHSVDQQIRAGIANQTILAGDVASKVAELMA